MKTLKYSFTLLIGLFLMAGCQSLELGPIDNYGSSNYWKTVPQIQAYVSGIHLDLRTTAFSRKFYMGEARGGIQVTGTGSQGASTFDDVIKGNSLTGDNTGISGWGGMYGYIFDCNLLIQEVEGKDLHNANKTEVDVLLAQAYAIRALHYFNLYRTFGGVPIVKEVKVLGGKVSQSDLYTPRSTPKEVMDFIKSDIDKALAYYASSGRDWVNNVTWSKAATQMLAAEVYLWSAKVSLGSQTPGSGDLGKAEGFLNEVKNSGRFQLQSNFQNIFLSSNEANSEIIFSINYADGEATSNVANFLYADANIVSFYDASGSRLGDVLNLKGTAIQRYEYTLDFWKSFDARDTRRNATFMEYYDQSGTVRGTVMKKFIGSINATGARVYDSNEPLYRYADVLLMLAEVENMKGGNPAQYINQIRQRAYGGSYNAVEDAYVNANFKANELAILKERDKEFVYEGKRWFDLLRMKDAASGSPLIFDVAASYKATPVLTTTEKHKVLWPVDKNTLNSDPMLKQTPGYSVAEQQEESW